MTNNTPGVTSQEVADQLQQVREQTVTWVTEQFCARHAGSMERYGEAGRHHCRQDVDYHLQYLTTAITLGSTTLFVDYIHWLTSVLENRGISVRHIRDCLELMDVFMKRHLSPGAGEVVGEILAAGNAALTTKEPDALPAFYQHLPSPLPEHQDFTTTLIAGDQRGARNIATQATKKGAGLVDVEVGIVQPALYNIGHLWQMNRVTVAQEHLATALCQNLLARLFTQAEMAEPRDRRAVFACVEKNFHSLGLRMISDAFEMEGWEVDFLGANTPTADLISHLDREKPDLLGLSLALPQHITTAKAAIERCHVELGTRRPEILVGGLALNTFDPLWKFLDADLWCPDARQAQRQASEKS